MAHEAITSRRLRDGGLWQLASLALVVLIVLLAPVRALAQGMFCDCDNTSICDGPSFNRPSRPECESTNVCDGPNGHLWALDPLDIPNKPPEPLHVCPCDTACGNGCDCDVKPGTCDTWTAHDKLGTAITRKCSCDRDCFSGPTVTGRIASRGLVLYKDSGELASAGDPKAAPRWVELAQADDPTTGIREGQALTNGEVFTNAGARTDVVPMSVIEFNQWVHARLMLEGRDPSAGPQSTDVRTLSDVAYKSADSEQGITCLQGGTRVLAADDKVAPIRAETHTVVIKNSPAGVPCSDLLLLQSPLNIALDKELQVYDSATATDGLTSLLISKDDGTIVAKSKYLIGYQTAFMTFSPEETKALPSLCRGNTAPIANPRIAEIEAWNFLNCRPGSMFATVACPNGKKECGALRAWDPIIGANVELSNYDSLSSGRTDGAGGYSLQYRVLPEGVFDFNVYATLRFDDFNPRMPSSRSYYLSSSFSATTDTTGKYLNFPVELAMLTMRAKLVNPGSAATVPLVDPTYTEVTKNLSVDGGTGSYVDPEFTTQYDPNLPPKPDLEDSLPPDPFRPIGLLKQISAADMRDTHIYVYRVADGRLIGSRFGLRHTELTGIRTDINRDGDLDDPGEKPSDDCEIVTGAGDLEPGACVQFSTLLRGPASRFLSQTRSDLNPAANVFPVTDKSGNITKPGRFGIELDYRDGTLDPRGTYLREGDQVNIIVINRATGYIGNVLAKMTRDTGGMMMFVQLNDVKPPQAGASADPVADKLQNGGSAIEMGPPNLKIRATRKPKGYTPESDPNVEYVIGFEGSGLVSDQFITIETEWYDRDGKPLPEDLPGYTGRLAKVVQPGSNDEVIQVHTEPDASMDGGIADGGKIDGGPTVGVALSPDPCIGCKQSPDGGAKTLTASDDPNQVGLFDIKPGRHIIVVRLPSAADIAHYYIHVDGASRDKNVDFTGRPKPAGPDFSVARVCYSNCGLAETSTNSGIFKEDCSWQCFMKQGGAGAEQLSERPASFVPFQVPLFDEQATRRVIEGQVAAIKQRLTANPPAPTDKAAVLIPKLEDSAVYRWEYRPEYQFSLFDLALSEDPAAPKPIKITTAYDEDAERQKTDLTIDYTLTGSSLPSLDPFGDRRSFEFGVGYESLDALLGTQSTGLKDIDKFLAMTPAQQLAVLDNNVEMLQPSDYLTIQLYQKNDLGNPLLEVFGVPVVIADVSRIVLERRFHHGDFALGSNGEAVPKPGAEDDASIAPYEDPYKEIRLGLTQTASITATLMALVDDPADPTKPKPVDIIDRTTGQPAVLVTSAPAKGTGTDQLKPGTLSLILDYGLIHRFVKANTANGSEPLISADKHPNFIVKLIAKGALTEHTLYIAGTIASHHDGLRLGEIISHDVLIQDGSLNLTREDFKIPGPGPELEFVRSYSNLGADNPDDPLGVGWSHNLDKRLIPLSTAKQEKEAFPSWVEGLRSGDANNPAIPIHFVPTDTFKAPDKVQWTSVSANGTTFRLKPTTPEGDEIKETAWVADIGRQGTLRVATGGDCETPNGNEPKCFIYKSKDGTQYVYSYPPLPGTIEPRQKRTSLSVPDGTVYRLYDGGPLDAGSDAGRDGGTIDAGSQAGSSGSGSQAGSGGTSADGGITGPDLLALPKEAQQEPPKEQTRWGRLLQIRDRNYAHKSLPTDHALSLFYTHSATTRLLTRVVDSVGRTVCYHYEQRTFTRPDLRSAPDGGARVSNEWRLVAVDGPYQGTTPPCDGAPLASSVTGDSSDGPIVLHFDYLSTGPLSKAQRHVRKETYGYALEGGVKRGDYNLVSTEYDEGSDHHPYLYAYYDADRDLGASGSAGGDFWFYFNDMRASDVVRSVTYPIGAEDLDIPANATPYTHGTDIPLETIITGTATFKYDNHDKPPTRSVTDLRGHTTQYTLDQHGDPLAIDGPGDASTVMEWRANGQNLELCSKYVHMSSSASGGSDRWIATFYSKYDENGNVTEEIGPISASAPARPTSLPSGSCSSAPGGDAIISEWNEFSQLKSRTDRNHNTEGWGYDNGNLTSHTDGAGSTTTYHPSTEAGWRYGLPREIIAPVVVDGYPEGSGEAKTSFDYEDSNFGNVSTTHLPGTDKTPETTYDIRGRLVTSEDALGQVTTYVYDSLDNVVLIDYGTPEKPDAFDDSFKPPSYTPLLQTQVCRRYDALGNKLTESDRNGMFLSYSYTARNQVSSVTRYSSGTVAPGEGCSPGGDIFGKKSFVYDGDGNLIVETDWKGNQSQYAYDAVGHRVASRNRLGFTMTEVPDLLGNQTSVTDYAGTTTATTYDAMSRPEHMTVTGPEGDIVRRRDMTYYAEPNPDQNLETITAWYTGSTKPTTKFEYNGRGQRKKRTSPLVGPGPDGSTESNDFIWEYDARGNLQKTTNEANEVTTYFYDLRDRLREQIFAGSAGGGNGGLRTHYDYDVNGNRLHEIRWRSDGDSNQEEDIATSYDSWNRPVVVQLPRDSQGNDIPMAYTYDGEGNVVDVMDRRGSHTTTKRDARGLPTSRIDRENKETVFSGYDANGNLGSTEIARLLGGSEKTTTQYDAEDQPYVVTEAAGSAVSRTTTFVERDGVGNPLTVQTVGSSPGGATTTYRKTSYGALHLPTKVCDPASTDSCPHFVQRTYHPSGQVATETNRDNKITKFSYDQRERLIAVQDPMAGTGFGNQHGPSLTFYDAVGRVTAQVDPRGDVSETVYDGQGRPKETHRYAARSLSGSFSGEFNTISMVPANAGTTDLVMAYRPDDVGNVLTETDRDGNVTTHEYDNRNQLIKTTFPATSSTNMSGGPQATESRLYDGNGNLEQLIDELGRETKYAYDYEDRRTSTTFLPDGAREITKQTYDEVGNMLTLALPENQGSSRQKQYEYDQLNRLTKITDEEGLATRYVYDGRDNLTSACTPRSSGLGSSSGSSCNTATEAWTEYTYEGDDGARGLPSQYKQHGDTATFTTQFQQYDSEGNLKTVVDPNGNATTYDYDDLNRRKSASFCTRQGGPGSCQTGILNGGVYETRDVSWDYDGNGNVTGTHEHKLDRSGVSFTDNSAIAYDEFDRPDNARYCRRAAGDNCSSGGVFVDYDYDARGNRTLVQVDTRRTDYVFDARNRLQTARFDSGPQVDYKYYADNQVGSVTYPNGARADYSYLTTGRLRTVTNTGSGGITLSTHTYDYDKNGNRKSQTETLLIGGSPSQQTTSYHYQHNDLLLDFTEVGPGQTRSVSYTYAGYNRHTETVTTNGGISQQRRYDYDSAQRLQAVLDFDPTLPIPDAGGTPIRAVTYQYDSNGNTLSRSDSKATATAQTFEYDSQNRLARASFTTGGVPQGIYDYDAAGMRVRNDLSDRGDVESFYDDGAMLEERIGATTLAHYRYSDRLVRLDQPGASGVNQVQYYHQDGLGSTVALSDNLGVSLAAYRVDPWGNLATSTSLVTASANRNVFTGHQHDKNTGLVYAGARYYDSTTGRFITQDSYLGELGTPPSLHRYLYAYGNPTVWTDPTGFESSKQSLRDLYIEGEEQGGAVGTAKQAGAALGYAWGYVVSDFFSFGALSDADEAIEAEESGRISVEQKESLLTQSRAKAGGALALTLASGGLARLGVGATGALVQAGARPLLARAGAGILTGAASGFVYQAGGDVAAGRVSAARDYAHTMSSFAAVGAAIPLGGAALARVAQSRVGQAVGRQLGRLTSVASEGVTTAVSKAAAKLESVARVTGEAANAARDFTRRVGSRLNFITRQVGEAELQEGAIADAVEGIPTGKLYGESRLEVLRKHLARRGVQLDVGDEFLRPNTAGGFSVHANGSARMILPSNPTDYVVTHELAHYVHWRKLGTEAYLNLPREKMWNAAEQFVFDQLENPMRWSRLSPAEREHAIWYIERVGFR